MAQPRLRRGRAHHPGAPPTRGSSECPEIPSRRTLLRFYRAWPSYRYLVNYLRAFPLKAGIRIRDLQANEQASFARPEVSRYRHLALGWLLAMGAIGRASKDPEVLRCIGDISRLWGVPQRRLLHRVFIPLEVVGIDRIRRQLSLEKSAGASDVRRLRQLQRRHPIEFGDRPILSGQRLRSHEHQWWANNFGLDKDSRNFTRQRIWVQTEFTLCQLLYGRVVRAGIEWLGTHPDGTSPDKVSWRAATRAVSRLLQACYPELSARRSEHIRSRHDYKLRSRKKTS